MNDNFTGRNGRLLGHGVQSSNNKRIIIIIIIVKLLLFNASQCFLIAGGVKWKKLGIYIRHKNIIITKNNNHL